MSAFAGPDRAGSARAGARAEEKAFPEEGLGGAAGKTPGVRGPAGGRRPRQEENSPLGTHVGSGGAWGRMAETKRVFANMLVIVQW